MDVSITYLSPHLDDAVLSCGGLIRQQVLNGARVTVITIFAGQPIHHELSPFAASLHARWGSEAEMVSERRREDQAAIESLGARTCHLDYVDAIYRSDGSEHLYTCERDLFGHIHPSEVALADEVAYAISNMLTPGEPLLFAPLGVGNHVDHQVVAAAALALIPQAGRLTFYEDYPYVERPGALTRRLDALREVEWSAELQPLSVGCIEAKIEAIGAYQSQLSNLFGGAEGMKLRITEYARAICPADGLAERHWRPLPRSVQAL